MPLENEGTAPAAPSAPAPPASAPAPAEEPRDLNAPPQPDAEVAEPDDHEEIEYEGAKYRVPKPLKDGFLMQRDYTRKTQEVAATRKSLEERQATLEQQAKAATEHRQELGQLAMADAQLSQYGNVDWQTYFDQDPIEAQKAWVHYDQLKDFKSNLEGRLATKDKERATAAQQETVKRLQETAAYAQQHIKGWTPELDAQIEQYATETFGFTRQELLQLVNPKTYRALHQAWLYAQTSKPQQAAAPAAAQPLQMVATRSSPGAKKPLAQVDDMEEYARRRRAGEKG